MFSRSSSSSTNTAYTRLLRLVCVLFFTLFVGDAVALAPHEIALIYNKEDASSVRLAEAYAEIRKIPRSNLCPVSIAETNAAGKVSYPLAITRERFLRDIYEPTTKKLRANALNPRILAWVYSCGLPTRVCETTNSLSRSSTKDLSITGATFLRGDFSKVEAVFQKGSPLYTGPLSWSSAESLRRAAEASRSTNSTASATIPTTDRIVPAKPAKSFSQSRGFLIRDTPLPSAMLAWTGPRGLSVEESVSLFERSAQQDRMNPTGTVWIANNRDVRSTARRWQFQPAVDAINALKKPGIEAVVSDAQPTNRVVIGYMTGHASPPVSAVGFLPAVAFADHLTSFAAAFDIGSQTKATEWLRAGAVMTAGTVVEPYAIWQKFPNAWVFVRLLQGQSQLEALYSSLVNPLQLLPLGDPLSRPWAPSFSISVTRSKRAETGKETQYFLNACPSKLPPQAQRIRYTWLKDGRQIGSSASISYARILDSMKDEETKTTLLLVVEAMLDGYRYQDWRQVEFFRP